MECRCRGWNENLHIGWVRTNAIKCLRMAIWMKLKSLWPDARGGSLKMPEIERFFIPAFHFVWWISLDRTQGQRRPSSHRTKNTFSTGHNWFSPKIQNHRQFASTEKPRPKTHELLHNQRGLFACKWIRILWMEMPHETKWQRVYRRKYQKKMMRKRNNKI